MKKFTLGILTVALIATFAYAGLRDRSSQIELFGAKTSPGNYIYFPEIASAPATPATGYGAVSVRGNDIYFIDDLGVETSMIGAASGGASNLDEAYDGGGAGAGRTVTVDNDAVILNGASDGNNVLEMTKAGGAGNVIDIANSGTGKDIDGTSSTWSFTKAGVMTLANGLTVDNGTNNVLSFVENSEDIDITFANNVIDFSTDTGAVQWDLYDGVASTLTKAADGAADDLTISVTGAQDSSLHLASAGTGADALTLTTSAGGIDLTVSGGAAGEDIDLTADTSINLSSTENAGSAIKLLTNGGTSETIVVTNTQGTGDAAIDINGTAGGVDIDAAKSITITSAENTTDSIVISSSVGGVQILAAAAAATEDILVTATGSSVKVTATENAADAIVLNASAGGVDITAAGAAGEDIDIDNSAGSVKITGSEAIADAVAILADAGGIDITSAATFDIDITATGGKILGVASEAAADQFKIDAQGTVVGDAINLETSDGGIMLNADGAANGDIQINAADDVKIVAGGDTIFSGSVIQPFEIVIAANVLTAAECGKTMTLTAAAEFETTLPAISTVTNGCTFRFIVTAAASGANYTVITGNTKEAIINGFVTHAGAYAQCASEDTITFVTGNAIGDWAEIISDGTNWIIKGEAVTTDKLTCTDEA